MIDHALFDGENIRVNPHSRMKLRRNGTDGVRVARTIASVNVSPVSMHNCSERKYQWYFSFYAYASLLEYLHGILFQER